MNRGPFWSVKGLLVTAALIVLAVVVVVVLVVSVVSYRGLVRRRNRSTAPGARWMCSAGGGTT